MRQGSPNNTPSPFSGPRTHHGFPSLRSRLTVALVLALLSCTAHAADNPSLWSLNPIANPTPPKVSTPHSSSNPIDAFVLARLHQANLSPAPETDRRTLLRRLTYDLTGLPPSPHQIQSFLADESPQAYEHLVDRLLASPQYAERWARHWLDVVRYSDSNGFKSDELRPAAWRYRDWVIRALDEDMPYDRFLTLQLAGDEVEPGNPDALTATGYLRLWPYESNQRDIPRQWRQILDNITDNTADTFLGLSMNCARCHDHKYDPITQKDYYRLQAFFAPLYPDDGLSVSSPGDIKRYRREMKQWNKEHRDTLSEMAALEDPVRKNAAQSLLEKFPDDLQENIIADDSDLSPYERQIKNLGTWQVFKGSFSPKKMAPQKQERWMELNKELSKSKPNPLLPVMAVRDVGPVSPNLSIPGNPKNETVPPGFLSVLNPNPTPISPLPDKPDSTGRRTALASLLTSPDNPLTSRVIVNRLWHHHFGRGIVATTNDFGDQGARPSHPELLDWLASRFVSDGWSLKKMHRLMVTSATYRQSAHHPDPAAATQADPENALLWRRPIQRLDAEQIHDAILYAGNLVDGKSGGPGSPDDSNCRAIYQKFMRNEPPTFAALFDGADGFNSCARREVTTTAPQALTLINSDWTLNKARAFADRVTSSATSPVENAYQIAFGRPPTSREFQDAKDFIDRQTARIRTSDPQHKTPQQEAFTDFCHLLLNANEFFYIE